VHLQKPNRAVASHPGEDNPHRLIAGIFGKRAKENVDGGAVSGYGRPCIDLAQISTLAPLQLEMLTTGRDINMSRLRLLAVLGLNNGRSADLV
jgi:hypothetical protein